MNRKSSRINRLKEGQVNKDQRPPASPIRPSSRAGTSLMVVDNKEKEELKATIRNLEEKLKGKNMYSLNILLLTIFKIIITYRL